MTPSVELVLDEHVGRVFERVLREREVPVRQAKDRFGEGTSDDELLRRCAENGTALLNGHP